MKSTALLTCLIATLLGLGGCAASRNDSDSEWQRAECNRKIDSEDRERCLKRLDGETPAPRMESPARRY